MDVLEKEIEDIIWDCLEVYNTKVLEDRGLFVNQFASFFRQIELGSYGRADIIGVEVRPKNGGWRVIKLDVYEFKKDLIDVNTLMQAARYVTAIRRMINGSLKQVQLIVSIHLIGKNINTNGDFVYLLNSIDHCYAYTYSIDLINGILFTRQYGYKLTEENLPSIKKYREEIMNQLLWSINPPNI